MKKILDRLTKLGKKLDDSRARGKDAVDLESRTKPPATSAHDPERRKPGQDRRRDRRQNERRDHTMEFARMWTRIEQNTHNFQVQLTRIGQMQAELDQQKRDLEHLVSEFEKLCNRLL